MGKAYCISVKISLLGSFLNKATAETSQMPRSRSAARPPTHPDDGLNTASGGWLSSMRFPFSLSSCPLMVADLVRAFGFASLWALPSMCLPVFVLVQIARSVSKKRAITIVLDPFRAVVVCFLHVVIVV